MAWIAPHSFSLVLARADGTPACTLDIHPSRLHPTAPAGVEDMVLALVALHHRSPLIPGRAPWETNPNGAPKTRTAFPHPDGAFGEASFLSHRGACLPERRTITADDTHLRLCDGRVFARADFNPPQSNSVEAIRAATNTLLNRNTRPRPASYRIPILGLCLGALSALDEQPIAPWGQSYGPLVLCEYIIGIANPLHARIGRSAAAFEPVRAATAHIGAAILDSWAIRPDRSWAPRTWTTGALFAQVCERAHPADIAAGRAAGAAVLAHRSSAGSILALTVGENAHTRLAAQVVAEAVTSALLRSYGPDCDRLRPRARKHATTLA